MRSDGFMRQLFLFLPAHSFLPPCEVGLCFPFTFHHGCEFPEASPDMWNCKSIKALFFVNCLPSGMSLQQCENGLIQKAERALLKKIPENVEVTLELGNRQRLEQFGGLRRRQENVGTFGTF